MIIKEFDDSRPIPDDKFGKPGHIAEKEMARRLKDEFSEHPEIFVFNDLRFVHGGRTAQIDHLVLHQYGFIIIESKSVIGVIQVNQHGEFTRTGNFKKIGMDSPIRQAIRQQDILRDLLHTHYPKRLKRFLTKFQEERFKVLVAISRSGEIKRIRCNPEELLKVDAVPDKIMEIIGRYRQASSVLRGHPDEQIDREYKVFKFKDHEMHQIKSILLNQHTPRDPDSADYSEREEEEAVQAEVAEPAGSAGATESWEPAEVTEPAESFETARNSAAARDPAGSPAGDSSGIPNSSGASAESQDTKSACGSCGSSNVNIWWNDSRRSYLFKCDDCGADTSIEVFCETCGRAARVSKSKLAFSKKCGSCETAHPYFTNSREM